MKRLIHCVANTAALLLLSISCGSNTSLDHGESSREPLAQGVFGHVIKWVGDFQCCPSTAKSYPLSVPVHVVAGTVPYINTEGPPSIADLPVVISVISLPDGTFGAGLDPGTYTLFAEIDGLLYLNSFTSQDNADIYSTVEVKPGSFATFDIQDTSESTF
jgi:hypothetical protein